MALHLVTRLILLTYTITTLADAESSWRKVGANTVCDTSAGEVYLKSSPGKLPNLEACKKSCQDDAGCKSITYFKSGWCSHFSTPCTKGKKGAGTTLTLVADSGTTKTPGQFVLAALGPL